MFDDIIKPEVKHPAPPNCPWLYTAITNCSSFKSADGGTGCNHLMKDNTCELMKTGHRVIYKEVDLSHTV